MRLHPAWLLLPLASLACAPTIGPVEVPAEVLVVLDGSEGSLRLYDVDSTAAVKTITLDVEYACSPTLLAVHGDIAAVGFASVDTVAMVNLITGDVALRPARESAPKDRSRPWRSATTARSIPHGGHATS